MSAHLIGSQCNTECAASRFAQRLYLSEYLVGNHREAQANQYDQDQSGSRVTYVPPLFNQSQVQLIPNNLEGQSDQEQEVGKYEQQKEFVVPVAKAIVDERTVMVE